MKKGDVKNSLYSELHAQYFMHFILMYKWKRNNSCLIYRMRCIKKQSKIWLLYGFMAPDIPVVTVFRNLSYTEKYLFVKRQQQKQ